MDQTVQVDSLRILLADDHHMVREALTPYVQRVGAGVNVLHAGSFAQAREQARQNAPLDMIILDLKMPGMDGLTGLREMRAEFPKTPIVILSGSDDPTDVAESIRLGANGFISKTMVGAALVNALKLVLDGELFIPAESCFGEYGQSGAPRHAPASRGNNAIGQLTPRQRAVLAELVEGYSNKEIAKRLDIEEITVKVHLQRIYKRLAVANRTQAVRRAMELGVKPR
ncbi:MAG TPA: response regulator transcription factor [Alphaproteobacteria bacterium]|nr:response regulator transcription factor [Alphaproteobacteria bacterium]